MTEPSPARGTRVLAALGVGVASAAIAALRHVRFPDHPPDFVPLWYSARAMLEGTNPYELVGPGLAFEWPWPNFYPATAMVAAIPFTPFSAVAAVALFVGLSGALLAWAVTSRGWDRLWLFVSLPYLIAVISAQWAPVLTAALILPPIAILFAVKPNLGLVLFVATGSARVQIAAIVGGIALVALSLVLLPGWPAEWWRILGEGLHRAPVTRLGGPLILLALLRWRRPEARLIAAMACVPQTAYWYEAVPLFLVPETRREVQAYSLVTSSGFLLERVFVTPGPELDVSSQLGTLMVALVYLPAVWIVLRRPNEGALTPAHAALARLAGRLLGRLAAFRRAATT